MSNQIYRNIRLANKSVDHGNCSATKRPYRKEKFRGDNCVLCCNSENIVITPNGRANNLDAAIARDDSNILEKIRSLDNVNDLRYHTHNKCFQSYVLKKTVDRIVRVRCSSCKFCPQCYNTSSAQIMRLKYILFHCVG